MPRTLTGLVIRSGQDKTAVVEVRRAKTHPLYGKKYQVSRKYLVHDPQNQAKTGAKVAIVESRPLSRHKRWALKSILVDTKEKSK